MSCYAASGVVTPAEMRALEQKATGAGYPALLLMEHAARALTDVLQEELGGSCAGKRVLFLCGKGNNGGDGLASARLFASRGGIPAVWLSDEPQTEDAKTNLRLLRLVTEEIFILRDMPDVEELFSGDGPREHYDAYVDAVFGTGFHGVPDALSVRMMMAPYHDPSPARHPVIAADIPSGINGETGETAGDMTYVHADVTVTFHCAKRGLYLTSHRDAVGRIITADIGLWALQDTLYADEMYPLRVLDKEDLGGCLPERELNAHKGTCGRVLICAGSMGMAGAAAMCAKACLAGGAGLVTVACDRELIPVLQSLVPCAMCMDIANAVKDTPAYDVFICGPGLGKSEEKWRNILALWDPRKPSVWDADALNMLSTRPMDLGGMAVITPHIGEATRLLGTDTASVQKDRVAAADALRKKFGCCAVLKSDVTVISDDDGDRLAACGSPALAKGGSGDVLCGLIGALLAQTGEPGTSASAGVLWHALAGAEGEKRYGMYELTAEKLIECLYEARKNA